ncbi:penicillin acylase family protein [Simiduia agarivorans]|uniref:Peptidase S45 penicillin amidase n=1 Tax=Simiduia agarivorans (strain DSM 21679 / JCM 13881 / BCRC 17597 / SA1) TaxID=1117647 RepID=K4KPX2_SIMAS|nr:penicillin acylase family protein [Simiduia agarivorans]AFV00306.1 peptidase S45 penicillin amidase [Simiduia agarivorans SA1 = DSM 21679]
MRFLCRRLVPFSLVLLLILIGCVYWLLQASLLPRQSTLQVRGISSPIAIRFDDYARPFVHAANLKDALYAQGVLHASERLWQMELLRLAGRADLHRLFDRDGLATDAELWRMGVPQLAEALSVNVEPEVLEWVRAYVQGINAGLARYAVLPPELLLLGYQPEDWTVEDVFAVGAIIAFQSGNNYTKELLRLALRHKLSDDDFALFLDDFSDRADYPFVIATAGRAAEQNGEVIPGEVPAHLFAQTALLDPARNPRLPRGAFGSNGWVVAPAKSATGKPLFAFDSHDALGLPNLFYELHLFFGRGEQIRGWSVPGLPGVINGYNEAIAWGFTNIGDTQDLFIETRHPEQQDTFLYDGEWVAAEVQTRTLTLADGSRVAHTRKLSRHGPLISEDPPISFAWTGHHPGEKGLGALLAINRATDWQGFNRAADTLLAPTLNATYADVHGTIGFRTAGVLPLRGRGQGLYPQDGSNGSNAWRGWVPVSATPRLENPAEGFVAAANARVHAAGEMPLVSADNAAPYRIARIQSQLAAAEAMTPARMAALQMDWYDGQAAWLLPHLLPSLSPEHAAWRTRFAQWLKNPVAAADSVEALVFQQWYLCLAETVFKSRLGEDYDALIKQNYVLNQALDVLIASDRHAQWWQGQRAQTIDRALAQALAMLEKQLGNNVAQWRLDRLQRAQAPHELAQALPVLAGVLNAQPAPWGGTPAAVGRANYRYDRPFQVRNGATVRVVAELDATIHAASVMPGGQSGHPLSDHYADQWPHWLAGDLLPIVRPADPIQQRGEAEANVDGTVFRQLILEPAQ